MCLSGGTGIIGTPPKVIAGMNKMETTRRVLALARFELRRLLFASFLAIGAAAVALVIPRAAGLVVDAALVDRESAQLNWVALILAVLFAAQGLLAYANTYLLQSAGVRLLKGLRERMFAHLVVQPTQFFVGRQTGELLSRIGDDLQKTGQILTQTIPNGIRAILLFTGTLVVMSAMNIPLTVVTLLSLIPVPLVAMLLGKRLKRLYAEEQDGVAASSARAHEVVVGIRTVKACGRESFEANRYRSLLDSLLGIQLDAAKVYSRLSGVLVFLGSISFVAVLWYGSRLVIAGAVSIGELTAFLLYMFTIAGAVNALGRLYAGLQQLRGTTRRMFEILDTSPSVTDSPCAVDLSAVRGHLRLLGVGYRYDSCPQDSWALRDVDLEITQGQRIAIVGPSGAGKSTMFSLLTRFFDPTVGTIELDGHDLRTISLTSLRRSIAVVPQEIALFHGSVADNIRYGALEASDEELRSAARAAGVENFVFELPDGYDTQIGEGGIKLSAGQRQRLAIARAMIQRPSILLLDEATSSLDADIEYQIRVAIERLMAGRTTLMIAHRLRTVQQADRIVVIDQGRIVATGNHFQLIERNPLYRRYWQLQAEGGKTVSLAQVTSAQVQLS